MQRYQYKIIPAPEKASKIKGLKGPARFAATLEQAMNDLGAEGWRYLRADTLPQEERAGLTATRTTYRNLLIFYRNLPEDAAEPMPAPPNEPLPVPGPDDTAPPADPPPPTR